MRIYTDGACRKGVGGWGWWNEDTDEFDSGGSLATTNQRMELTAALEAVGAHYKHLDFTIVSDSAYVVNCFGERWWAKWLENGWLSPSNKRGISNRDIWEPLLTLVEHHGRIKFEHVKGHSGDPGNDVADWLATSEVRAQFEREQAYGRRDRKEDRTDRSGIRYLGDRQSEEGAACHIG